MAKYRPDKASLLIRALEILQRRRGEVIPPSKLEAWDETKWDLLAMSASVNLPRPETRALVIVRMRKGEAQS